RMSSTRSGGRRPLFVVYRASMSPAWPMKNWRYACVILPRLSARRSWVSQYARRTYGRHRKPAARIAFRMASPTLIEVRNAFLDERRRGLRALHLDLEFPLDAVEGEPRPKGLERRFDVPSCQSGVFHRRHEIREEVPSRVPRHSDEVLRPDLPRLADVPEAS